MHLEELSHMGAHKGHTCPCSHWFSPLQLQSIFMLVLLTIASPVRLVCWCYDFHFADEEKGTDGCCDRATWPLRGRAGPQRPGRSPSPAFFHVPSIACRRVSSALVTLVEGIGEAGALKITCICLWIGRRPAQPPPTGRAILFMRFGSGSFYNYIAFPEPLLSIGAQIHPGL